MDPWALLLIFTASLSVQYILKYSFQFLTAIIITKTVTLNIRDEINVTVTGLPLDASLYDVMHKAENENKLT